MAKTTKSDVLIPEIFTAAVRAAFAQKGVFKGSMLGALGAAVVDGSFGGGRNDVGNEVEVPYFGTLGEFEELADGVPATPKKIQQTGEKATVTRSALAFEATRWSRNAKGGVDPYEEAARQVVLATNREADRRLINAALLPGGLVKSVYNASTPVGLTYDTLVDARMLWGDEDDDVVGMVVHSKAKADLFKMRDSTGRPILTDPKEGDLPRFMGMPIATSDRASLLTGSAMGTVASTGTSPPAVTLAGTPAGAWDLKIIIAVGGSSNGTAKFKFSVDGGSNYSAELTVPNGGGPIALTDAAIDSLVGVNGYTGVAANGQNTSLTATFTNGTYNVDNVYTAKASLKARSLLLRRNSLAFWFNSDALALQTDRDIFSDSDVGALHLYAAALRYRRRPGGTKPGVVTIEHNVGGY